MLEKVKIVLANTTHPGNIGAAARAMKTMGLSRLALVAPKRFPSAECAARAAGADDILAQAQVCARLEEAVAECGLVFGASARVRNIAWPALSPAAVAAQALARARVDSATAVVFGCEQSGLSNEQLELCHAMTRIPTSADFSSLNLAAAVQIVCYELRKQLSAPSLGNGATGGDSEPPFPTADEMEHFYRHFQQTLTDIGYFDPAHPRRLMRRIKRLFNRAQLDGNEYNILRGILAAIQNQVKPDR